jgi:dipeptidyl aminopeptidase/acylaminoacyl peptidase
MRDITKLMSFAQAGLYSPRADPTKISVVGGSVSTVYAYLLLRELENSPARDRIKAAVMYGGLVDMFRFRYDWERKALYIDPGISQLEDLLIAFGRPDNRPEHYLMFSTLYHLDQKSLPPTLLVHAEKDSIVPVNQSQLIAEAATRLSIPHELLIYQNIEHYLDMSQRDPAQLDMLYKTIDFLKQNAAGS